MIRIEKCVDREEYIAQASYRERNQLLGDFLDDYDRM